MHLRSIKRIMLGLVVPFSLALVGSTAQAADQVCAQPKVVISGGEQMVFNWKTDRCTKMDFPDVPADAFIDNGGRVQLLASNANGNYRMIGTSLDNVKRDCSRPVFVSNPNKNAGPHEFYNRVWLTSPWTNDGKTIYALVHNEFDAWFSSNKQYCESQDKTKCWYPNAIQAVSTDSGKSYQPMRKAGAVQLAMVTPYQYIPDADTAGNQQGMVSQSNILSKKEADGRTYYYAMVVRAIGHGNKPGTCLFRTPDITNPEAWQAWDGNGFTVAMHNNPYTDPPTTPGICTPIFTKFFCSNWTYNTVLHKYLAICRSNHFPKDGGYIEAFVYSTSADMVHWSQPQLLKQINWQGTFRASAMNSGVTAQTYPSILDPTSAGRNFEFTNASPYLYYTRFNPKMHGVPWQNRDLVRVPLSVSCGG